MLTVGERYQTEIVDMGHGGEGIGKIDGIAVFIRGGVLGDLCQVEITGVKKNLAFGKIMELERPSEFRMEPECDFALACGGCSLASLHYEGQIRLKERQVREALRRIGGIENPPVLPIIEMEEPYHYRNHGQFPIGWNQAVLEEKPEDVWDNPKEGLTKDRGILEEKPAKNGRSSEKETVAYKVISEERLVENRSADSGFVRKAVIEDGLNPVALPFGRSKPGNQAKKENKKKKEKENFKGKSKETENSRAELKEKERFGGKSRGKFKEELERNGDGTSQGKCKESADRKSKVAFTETMKGKSAKEERVPAVGFYREKSHQVVDCPDCKLQSAPAVAAAEAVRKYIRQTGASVYNERTGKGLLRHVIVRNAEGTGEVMVVLVIQKGQGELPEPEELFYLLQAEIGEIDEEWKLRSLALSIHSGKNGGVLGEKLVFLYGQERITDSFDGLEFLISPGSFYQVNTKQMKKLYGVVRDFAALEGTETVFDLYCGVGTISLYLAAHAKQVIGIEVAESAILDANRNAIRNGIVNVLFHCGKAEVLLPEMVEQGGSADVAILDPPRAGCDKKLLDAVAEAGVARIVYVSCNPSTLARDVKYLEELGYRMQKAQPVDMFPWTVHVETVCLLSNRKLKPDTHVNLSLSMDDYYRIKEEGKNNQ